MIIGESYLMPTQLLVPLLKFVMYLSSFLPSLGGSQRSGLKANGSGKMVGSVETKYVVEEMRVYILCISVDCLNLVAFSLTRAGMIQSPYLTSS